MGGQSKKPLSIVEKRQQKIVQEAEKKKEKRGQAKQTQVKESASKQVEIDEGVINKVLEEISKEKFITPYILSERLSISMTSSKHLLRKLREMGKVRLVSKNRRIEIYQAA
jgi:small subunit ribosomal protein S25e